MRIGPTMHYNAGRKLQTYIIVQELMDLQLCICVEIGFLPRRISSLTLSVTHNAGHNYVHVHVRTSVQVLLEEAHKWNSRFCS